MGDRYREIARLNKIGYEAWENGNDTEARKYYEEAFSKVMNGELQSGHQEESKIAAATISSLGRLSEEAGDFKQSIEYYEKALTVYFQIYGDQWKTMNTEVAEMLNTLGTLCMKHQKINNEEKPEETDRKTSKQYYNRAHAHFSQALGIYRRFHGPHGCSYGMAQTLCNLGNLAFVSNKPKDAEAYYKLSLTMYSRSNKSDFVPKDVAETEASLLNNLGSLYRQRRDFPLALDYFKQALTFEYMAYGNKGRNPSVSTTLGNCGDAARRIGKLAEALRFYEKCLQTCPSKKAFRDFVSYVLIQLGSTRLQMDDVEKARRYFMRSLQLYQDDGSKCLQEADTWYNLGILERKVHNHSKAALHHEKALDILNEQLRRTGPTQKTQRLKKKIRKELLGMADKFI